MNLFFDPDAETYYMLREEFIGKVLSLDAETLRHPAWTHVAICTLCEHPEVSHDFGKGAKLAGIIAACRCCALYEGALPIVVRKRERQTDHLSAVLR